MTDREKLVELINEGVEIYSDGWQKQFGAAEAVADHLIANGVTVTDDCKACAEATQECIVGLQEKIAEMRKKAEWISVKDRLPEDGRDVVVFTNRNGGTVEVAYYRYAREAWFHDCILLIPDVLSWMPLPEAPKEK